ncbi:MAG: P-type conjugative transfer ATPase TrbB [Candidatus Omnitrophica bacterium]|nr:P-type conjugative transfer ATPase TrbB [Candidatus Omnitrophota bacterium]
MIQHQRINEKISYDLGEEIFGAIRDPQVIEIMLNEDSQVWIDTYTGMRKFCELSPEKAKNFINTIASINETEVNKDCPNLSTEIRFKLEDGYQVCRFQALVPPVVSYPVFSIRKPARKVITLQKYCQDQVITLEQYQAIVKAVEARKSILVAGSTGSGKTTLCNAILDQIAQTFPEDRIAIIEDTLELQCNVKNRVSLKTSDNRSMDDLLRYCMRLRPDRIIVGEVRGKEAHTLIKALNTGHPGGLSTIHANNAARALMRLEQLILEANVAPVPDTIAEAINMVVNITRSNKNSAGRLVNEILEVKAFDKKEGQYVLEPVIRSR